MPSGVFTIDNKLGQKIIEEGRRFEKRFFDVMNIREDAPRSESFCKEHEEFVLNGASRLELVSKMEDIGFYENGTDDEILFWNEDDVTLIPDFIRIYHATTSYFSIIALKICQLDRHTDPQEVMLWEDKFKVPKPCRCSIKLLWGKKEIESFIESYEADDVKANFGTPEYRGHGSVSALDDYELGVYNLSHGLQDIIDHFNLWFDNNTEAVYSYTRFHKLTRRAVKEARAFPCPYQTIERDSLSAKEDTVVGTGQKGNETSIFQDIWWDEYENNETPQIIGEENFDEYQLKEGVRKRFLSHFESLGLVENRPMSPYGLLYRKFLIDDGTECLVPDFVRINDKHPTAVVFIDDTGKGKDDQVEYACKYKGIVQVLAGLCRLHVVMMSKLDEFEEDFNQIVDKRGLNDVRGTLSYLIKNDPDYKAKFRRGFVNPVKNKPRDPYKPVVYSHVENYPEYERDVEILKNYADQHLDEYRGTVLTGSMSIIKEKLNVNTYILSNYTADVLSDVATRSNEYVWSSAFNYVDDPSKIPDECKWVQKSTIYKRFYESSVVPSAYNGTVSEACAQLNLRQDLGRKLVSYGYFANSQLNPYGLIYLSSDKYEDDIVIPDFIKITDKERKAILLLDRDMSWTEYVKIDHILTTDNLFEYNIVWSGVERDIFEAEIDNGSWNVYKNPARYRGKEDVFWTIANDPRFIEIQKSGRDIKEAVGELPYPDRLVEQVDHFLPYKDAADLMDFDFPQYPFLSDGLMHSSEELLLESSLKPLGLFLNVPTFDRQYKTVKFNMCNLKTSHPDYATLDKSVVLEFNGTYYHRDPMEPLFKKTYYDAVGVKCAVIWEHELKEFMQDVPNTLEELCLRYPCTWRNADVINGRFETEDKGYAEKFSELQQRLKRR